MSKLRHKPMRHRRAANYPTKLDVLATPRLLEKHLPPAWLAKAELAGVAGLFLAANMVGCGAPAAPTTKDEPSKQPKAVTPSPTPPQAAQPATPPVQPAASPTQPATPAVQPAAPTAQPAASTPAAAQPPAAQPPAAQATPSQPIQLSPATPALVAPLFLHGEGRGSIGCVVITPPAFLSEEEAIQIIKEELAIQGVDFTRENVELFDIMIPQNNKTSEIAEKPLSIDLFNDNSGIAIEFVSKSDYMDLGGSPAMMTVQNYDFKKVAQGVDDRVQTMAQERIRLGTFYDPATKMDFKKTPDPIEAEREALTTSKLLLKEQVKDFADWLKAQGII